MSGLQTVFGQDGFDTNSVDPQQDFVVLPPGEYVVEIEKSDVKETKSRNGSYLEVQMVVIDGAHKGRKLWDRINVSNPNQDCERIGLACLSALGRACGIPKLNDEALLLQQIVVAHVKVKDSSFGAQNNVRTYSSLKDYQAKQQQQPTQPQQILPPAQQAPPQQPVQPAAPTQVASPVAPPQQVAPAFMQPQMATPQVQSPQQQPTVPTPPPNAAQQAIGMIPPPQPQAPQQPPAATQPPPAAAAPPWAR
jgi:hypothetical protein